MADASRAVIAKNDAALKAQMLNSPTKIKRVIVGAGYAAVATYVTLPEAERQQTIGVGFADPWSLRSELLMGQTADYLQVAGFPSFADIDHVNKGGYLPSSVFADTTALARAQAGMAVFPGWAGQSEHFDPAVHAAGATDVAKDLNLKQKTKEPDDADIKAQVEANAAQDEAAKLEKKIKPIATADEHMNQKGVAKGRTLIVGAGAAAAWNAQKVKDASGDYAWVGRPAPAVPGMTPSQPRGQMLLRESFLGATGGGNRNDGVLDWSKMFLGVVSKIEITKPTDASAMEKPKFDTPGANAKPPKRTAEQKKEPWQTSAEYKVRVPINMDGTSVLVYAQNLDLSSGPGPARKLNVGAPGQNPGDEMDPARGRGLVQVTQENAGKGDKLALPEEIEVDAAASPGDRDGRDDGQLPAPPSGKFGQVVLSIGQDANAPGGINDLIKNNGITTTIIWDRVMADPKNEWDGQRAGLPPASPLGVENKAMGIRVLGAAATEGPGILPDDAVVYKLAQNAHLGRLGDAGGRAEGGVSRLAGTFQAANSQLDGGPGTPLPYAGENNADVPTGADKGKEKKPGQLDPSFVPAARENDAQKATAFARRMEGYAAQGLTSGEDAARVKQQADALGGQQQGAQQATTPQQSASPQQPAAS